MKISKFFLPTLKENPLEASVISHQLMIRAGMIRQTASGIYSWLPLGLKILQKVENIIRSEMNKSGALEILMPTIQPAELWLESGRYEVYGKEMLKIKDRHQRDLLYGPTHEEVVTDIFRNNIFSYKDLPKNLYQIHWKFRDEIRPRFGLMRGREFLMKDSYSFDIDEESSRRTYDLMYLTYFKIFRAMGLKPMAIRADTGAIGGNLSHEFHILANTGESVIFYDKKFDELANSDNIDIEAMQKLYAMADEMHNPDNCKLSPDQIITSRSIEVGHIFNFNVKYSKAMNAVIANKDGDKIFPQMGSYGIGVSRVIAAAIEANNDDKGIIWPKELSPFDLMIINIRGDDAECIKYSDKIYNLLQKKYDILYDDSNNQMGQKLAIADLIGIRYQIIIGPRNCKNNNVEVKNRSNGKKIEISLEDLLNNDLNNLL
jgi:prolyl-tRNA synthetase